MDVDALISGLDLSNVPVNTAQGYQAEEAAIDQDFFVYINHVVFTKEGVVIGSGRGSKAGFVLSRQAGGLIIEGVGKPETHYVDVSVDPPVIRERPVFAGTLDRTELPVRVEAVVADVPACLVRYAGPMTGSFEHLGGDLKVGFTVPGAYEIEFEPFPCLPMTFSLVVTP